MNKRMKLARRNRSRGVAAPSVIGTQRWRRVKRRFSSGRNKTTAAFVYVRPRRPQGIEHESVGDGTRRKVSMDARKAARWARRGHRLIGMHMMIGEKGDVILPPIRFNGPIKLTVRPR
jgi:hypothetical protein